MISARRTSSKATPRTSSREGFSLIEVLVAVSLLGVVLLALAGGATLALSQMAKARQDIHYAADVQQVADSLVTIGYNNVEPGETTVRGRSITWDVEKETMRSVKVTIVVQRPGQANSYAVYPDTVALYLSDTRVQ
jgi:prepilin-type N-terminal cleavage/methylation domain-containing protein